jgi:hypothetical protein
MRIASDDPAVEPVVIGGINPSLLARSIAPGSRFKTEVVRPVDATSQAPSCANEQAADEDTESRVAAILRENPRKESPVIAGELGLDDRTIRNTEAWKTNRQWLKEQKTQRWERHRRLTPRMIAAIPSQTDDPAEIAAARESQESITGDDAGHEDPDNLERRYLESVDASQRAEYHNMTPEQRKFQIEAWKLTDMA